MQTAFRYVREQAPFVARLVLVGVLLGVGRTLLYPLTDHLGDSDEINASADLTLAVLGLLAGIVTATGVVLRPGRRPVARSMAAVVGSLLGGLFAWPVTSLFGKPTLLAPGVLLVWPVATALALFVASLLPGTAERLDTGMFDELDDDAERARRLPNHAR